MFLGNYDRLRRRRLNNIPPKTATAAKLDGSGILNEKEVDTLYKAAEKFERLQATGEIAELVKAINKVSKLGVPR